MALLMEGQPSQRLRITRLPALWFRPQPLTSLSAQVASITPIRSLRLVMHEWLRRHRMRGHDSHETSGGQALLGSQALARQSLTTRGSQAADRSGGRTRPVDRSAGQTALSAPRRQPTSPSIDVRVRRPGSWRLSSDYPSDGRSQEACETRSRL
jgi:hypothetical protein